MNLVKNVSYINNKQSFLNNGNYTNNPQDLGLWDLVKQIFKKI